MTTPSIASLSDHELLAETRRAVETERHATAALVLLLAEVDARRLYLGQGYSSLFAYCTRALRLSEQAAYARIEAARNARRHPRIFGFLADGSLSLTTVGVLAPHLSDENHEAVLDAARHKSKREVERLVAAIQPQPDISSSIRALPMRATNPGGLSRNEPTPQPPAQLAPPPRIVPAPRAVIAPLAPLRYLIRMTVPEETHRKLERARDLLRHQIPNGDPAAILDRALTLLIEQAERVKVAATRRPPRGQKQSGSRLEGLSRSRRIPARIRRVVWARDQSRCAFVGADGRCAETGHLEFHHVRPFALGGSSDAGNLQLRCRAHNVYEAVRDGLDWRPPQSTRSGPS